MMIGPLLFSPGAFWLAIPVAAALLVARLYRARRREVLTGSLLLWRRLAAAQPKLPPRRWPFDLSFFLQLAALLLLVAALSEPTWAVGAASGRELLLVIDNGPISRARGTDGAPLLQFVTRAAAERLRTLKPDDRVYLARSSPAPALLSEAPLAPGEALSRLGEIVPALSGPSAERVWQFCADTARNLRPEVRRETISLRAAPLALGAQWRCVAPPGLTLDNVAIVGVGSVALPAEAGNGGTTQLLVRLHNFSKTGVAGTVRYKFVGTAGGPGPDDAGRSQACSIEPDGDAAVVFSIAQQQALVRVRWIAGNGRGDALPEDDCIVAAPRPVKAPRIRFFPAPIPALQKLFSGISPPAVIVAPSDNSPVDLEIRSGNVPEAVPETARALMLLSPDDGFQSVFKTTGGAIKQPVAQKGADDELTKIILPSPESLFQVGPARAVDITGALKVLIKDRASDRPLVATLKDDRGRAVYLFTFTPGQGQALERPLEWELAALLVAMADQAAGSGEPYVAATVETLEQTRGQRGEPMPLNWSPQSDDNLPEGAGVLNETASRLELGAPGSAAADDDEANWGAALHADSYKLAPLLIWLALLLAAVELWLERPGAVRRVGA